MKKAKNNLVGLVLALIFSLLCIICFIYYTKRFIPEILQDKETIRWIFFGTFIFVTFILGIINLIKNNKLQLENFELKKLIIQLQESSDEHYYSTLGYIQNSREISLDVLNELREKP